jgi:hypothetical protein
MSKSNSPEEALERLLKITRKVAWNPRLALPFHTRLALKHALEDYDVQKRRPTAYSILLEEDSLAGEAPVPSTICKTCKEPMHVRRKGQKYCSTRCRQLGYLKRKKRRRHSEPV